LRTDSVVRSPHRRALALLGLGFLSTLLACKGHDRPADLRPASDAPPAPVEIHIPEKLTSVPTGKTDALGRPIRAACVTCHSLRRPDALPTSPADLDQFHVGLKFEHGELSCGSCHVIGEQDSLRRADGATIPMRDAMSLCAQCHGPQFRDYSNGAHGGMNGHWDRSRGARVRNHCVDCHDPHVPAFQPSTPVLPPRDRGVLQDEPHAGEHR
jgi:formate-dependent nitrite reductase cytochrome c552 subunit